MGGGRGVNKKNMVGQVACILFVWGCLQEFHLFSVDSEHHQFFFWWMGILWCLQQLVRLLHMPLNLK